ncbi:oligosaccharide flippase family protein [Patescibacteria group bacterium]
MKKRINDLIKHPLMSGGIIMVGGNMVANVVNYLYHLVMGRVLGPVDYGVLASLYSIMYLIGVVPLSASVSIVKFISSAKDQEVYSIYSSINIFVTKLAIIASVLFLICSPFIAGFLHITNMWTVVLLVPVLFFTLATLVNQATAQGLLKFAGTVIPTLFSSLTKFLLGIALVFMGWSVFGAMVGVVFGIALAFLYSRWFVRRLLKKNKIRLLSLKPFIAYSFPVLIQALAFTSLFTVDVILVKHFFSPHDAGIYAALSTLGKVIFFASSPITATMFPIVSKRKSNKESYNKIFLMSLLIILVVGVLITSFYWLFPSVAIGALYGAAYLSAESALVWMGLFILFYSLSFLLVNYALSLGDSKVVYYPFIAAILQAPMIWFFHSSLLQVIQISFTISVAMFVFLGAYLGYNHLRKSYE